MAIETTFDETEAAEADDFRTLYDTWFTYVFRSLHRLGVPEREIPDLMQEVFRVVLRRHRATDLRPMRPWLWGICLRIAKNYRRRAHVRVETFGAIPERVDPDHPEDVAARRQAQAQGLRALEALTPEKRAVFVLFEVEGRSSAEIAGMLGVPPGTVHSRLHAARSELLRRLRRNQNHGA